MTKLDILYEDNSVIIVNKPAGLAVQGGKGVKISLDKLLAESHSSEAGQPPLLVHRLDKDTSGVLLAAKTKQDAARFSQLFNSADKRANGTPLIKQYIAVCADLRNQKDTKENEGIIAEDLKIKNTMKKSQTKYKIIKSGKISCANFSAEKPVEYSIMEIELDTGRMHQIRRHLAMIGCPVLGDDKYGNFKLNKKLKIKKLMLHAQRLIIKEAKIDVKAPLPPHLSTFMN